MQQLVYVSTANSEMETDQVFSIIEASSRNNLSRNITGFLMFHQGRFLQLVEGEREDLDGLMQVLETDDRHHSIDVVDRGAVEDRLFSKWRMKRVAAGSSLADASFDELRSNLPAGARSNRILELVEGFLQLDPA
ncbi:BLUF domain-containing protein [Parerythrobacter aestuarii]|uniref:BLUF domain-containing protein n=1 Tax=Parerythrobacter aestuarii TaxID=3020909 RepID=UPI0024DE88C4|nr:BLUF domain-containing protein [Parerythrobacter aestuarii]